MLWVKAFHIIAVVSWFAGIFYLPRLFVYHAMSDNADTRGTLKIMERKLYRFVTPAMWIALILGVWLLFSYAWSAYQHEGWLIAKLVLVAALIAYHFYLGHLVKVFRDDRNTYSHVFYRWLN